MSFWDRIKNRKNVIVCLVILGKNQSCTLNFWNGNLHLYLLKIFNVCPSSKSDVKTERIYHSCVPCAPYPLNMTKLPLINECWMTLITFVKSEPCELVWHSKFKLIRFSIPWGRCKQALLPLSRHGIRLCRWLKFNINFVEHPFNFLIRREIHSICLCPKGILIPFENILRGKTFHNPSWFELLCLENSDFPLAEWLSYAFELFWPYFDFMDWG